MAARRAAARGRGFIKVRRRPIARTCCGFLEFRQTRPVQPRASMMLEVVTVIEEQKVVELAVITDCAASVLVITVQRTKTESSDVPRQVNGNEEQRHPSGDRSPKGQHEC